MNKITTDEAIEILKERVEIDRKIRETDVEGSQGSKDYNDFCERECVAMETVIEEVEKIKQEREIVFRQIIELKPQKVCCKRMIVKIAKTASDEYIVEDFQTYGGCKGNLLAIGKLIKNKTLIEIIELLLGNQCGDKGTSCTDQLAIGLQAFLNAKQGGINNENEERED